MDNYIVGKFVPYMPQKLETYRGVSVYLSDKIGSVPHYTGRGRWALLHCIQLEEIKKILIPAYICSSILDGLIQGGVNWDYYDLDILDLNADIVSIEKKLLANKYDAVLVASMYGNPAAMDEIEIICKKHSVLLIDDAAQSFGATLNDRPIGTFGNYGFFSFSPGKPAVAHMGAFYWCNTNKHILVDDHRKQRYLLHLARFKSFIAIRRNYYSHCVSVFDKVVNKIGHLLEKFKPSYDDGISFFEDKYFEEVLVNETNYCITMRNERFSLFVMLVQERGFRIIKPLRGSANPHKIVLLFDSKSNKNSFAEHLLQKGIYSQNGYCSLEESGEQCPAAYAVQDVLLELPVDESAEKFMYMINVINNMK